MMKTVSLILAGLMSPLSGQEAAKKPAVAPDAAKLAETVANCKQLGIALFEFDTEFGELPSKDSAIDVAEVTGTTLPLRSTTSNDYFRQLLVMGLKTEKIFQLGAPAKPADNRLSKDDEALAQGECDFSYVTGLTISAEPSLPLVVAPLVPGKLKFDPGLLGGKAVVLRLDLSVTTYPITPEGDVIVDGKSLFDPAQPFWNGRKIEVAWPK